jgi:hypothetical protein
MTDLGSRPSKRSKSRNPFWPDFMSRSATTTSAGSAQPTSARGHVIHQRVMIPGSVVASLNPCSVSGRLFERHGKTRMPAFA